MSATNQTSNYDLPLFIGTDKPSWLGDFNGAMNAIDTAIKGRADDISSLGTRMTATETVANTASSNASTALTNANNAQTTANTALSNAETADTKAVAAQSTANTALSNASTAQTTADTANATAQSALTLGNSNAAEIEKLNLINFDTFDYSTMTTNYGSISNLSSISVATNSDGSIGKIYGRVIVTNPNTANEIEVTIANTRIRPSQQIIITGSTLRNWYVNDNINDVANTASIIIATNGTIKLKANCASSVTRVDINAIACLLFFKDFGDE